jgi:hypothetical protein
METSGVGEAMLGAATAVGAPVAALVEAEAPAATVCTEGVEGTEGTDDTRLCLAILEWAFERARPPASCAPPESRP